MSYDNVPDDWGSYYTNCAYCRTRYHMSEGGCDCTEGAIAESNRPWLQESGYEFEDGWWVKSLGSKRHTCRRNHKDGTIKVGQIYRKYTHRHICDEDGASSLSHRKRVIA